MKHFSTTPKWFVIGVCCIFILSLMILPAHAARRSHGLAITLFVSGMGMQVGSTLLDTSAQNQYEDYLSTTIQADIQSQKSTVVARNSASVVMSRVGFGCIGLAVILSIRNQLLDTTATPEAPVAQTHGNPNLNTRYATILTSSHISLRSQILGESQMFSFRPHYDFQNQRASLQFLHRF